ncbi:MAG TPA: hypothetical protein VMM15_39160 [Bradyrhizobium sp.]|nr:hypothetical protein [Bradyrhizobium sp.]
MSSEIGKLIERFVSGTDTSIAAANEIELILDDGFPNDDFIQHTVEMLSMYGPEGEVFLFDRAVIIERLIKTIEYLQDQE